MVSFDISSNTSRLSSDIDPDTPILSIEPAQRRLKKANAPKYVSRQLDIPYAPLAFVLNPVQIFAIRINDSRNPPPPGYLDCGNFRHICDMPPPTFDSSTDADMLISFIQSGAVRDEGYTWADVTELLRWLFEELTKRLNHFLDAEVRTLPQDKRVPMLLKNIKGVPHNMSKLVKWSKNGRNRKINFREFEDKIDRLKQFDLGRELSVRDMMVLITEAKHRSELPRRSRMAVVVPTAPVRQPPQLPLPGAEKEARKEPSSLKPKPQSFAKMAPGSPIKFPPVPDGLRSNIQAKGKRQMQVFKDPQPVQPKRPTGLVPGAKTAILRNTTNLPPKRSRTATPGIGLVGCVDPRTRLNDELERQISPLRRKRSGGEINIILKRRKKVPGLPTNPSQNPSRQQGAGGNIPLPRMPSNDRHSHALSGVIAVRYLEHLAKSRNPFTLDELEIDHPAMVFSVLTEEDLNRYHEELLPYYEAWAEMEAAEIDL